MGFPLQRLEPGPTKGCLSQTDQYQHQFYNMAVEVQYKDPPRGAFGKLLSTQKPPKDTQREGAGILLYILL